MTLKSQQVVYLLAAGGMLAALVMPLSSEPTGSLAVRPALCALTVLTAMLYAASAFAPLRLSIGLTVVGVLLGCYVTLALLDDATVAGYAASGFWLAVSASWIAAWAAVAKLASVKPADKTASRFIDLAIPILFGAFLFYLWEVAVRGFGVPSVLFPAPSAIAVRFASSLQMLWEDFFQTFLLAYRALTAFQDRTRRKP